MTDFSSAPESDPARDVRLGLMLRGTLGATPHGDVNWASLAKRIGNSLPAQIAAPWWTYAARWERRAIPLALAAGIIGTVALWGTPGTAMASAMDDLMVSVASGVPAREAASQFSDSLTGTVDYAVGMPE